MAEEMAELYRTGRAVFGELVAGGEDRLDRMFAAAPALAELAVGTVYGHLHARQALDPRTREAVALAAIIAAGTAESPLSVHVRTGLAAGLTPGEISEILVETAAFAGFPRAVTAAGKLPELFAAAGSPVPPEPTPREVLLTYLDQADQASELAPASDPELAQDAVRALRSLLGSATPQVLTTGPDAAIAIFTAEDGGLLGVTRARVDAGRIQELATVTRG
jgi:4-carboxymuconolactone decarboxylase